MMFHEIALIVASIAKYESDRDRDRTKGMTPAERKAYFGKRDAIKLKAEAELAAEAEADRNYRNSESPEYDPLRCLLEKRNDFSQSGSR